MGWGQLVLTEIHCDFPECDEYFLFHYGGEINPDMKKVIDALGWTVLEYSPESDRFDSAVLWLCPECKKEDIPIKEEHECVFARYTKQGKPSRKGTILTCVFCERTKFDIVKSKQKE